MSEFEKIQKLVRDMQSSETPVLPVYEPNLFSIAKEAYRLARAEVIEGVRKQISNKETLLYNDPNVGEFIDDICCVRAVAINDINSILDKLEEKK